MFSLIVTTQGDRNRDFIRLCDSLEQQTYKKFELILIDQTEGDELKAILERYSFKYVQKKIEKSSLSRARNMGLDLVSGDIVAFPDDDCWYPRTLLEDMKGKFDTESAEVICCNAKDPIRNVYLNRTQTKCECVEIHPANSFRYIKSITIFARYTRIRELRYDERFGVGARWGSGEETDYLLQMIYEGARVLFFSKIDVYHPYHDDSDSVSLKKVYTYGVGFGALIEKSVRNRKQYGTLWEYYKTVIRSVGGVVVYLIKRNEKYKIYINRLKGMKEGRKQYHDK